MFRSIGGRCSPTPPPLQYLGRASSPTNVVRSMPKKPIYRPPAKTPILRGRVTSPIERVPAKTPSLLDRIRQIKSSPDLVLPNELNANPSDGDSSGIIVYNEEEMAPFTSFEEDTPLEMEGEKMLIVIGGTAELAPLIIEQARKNNYLVRVLTSRTILPVSKDPDSVYYLQYREILTKREDYKSFSTMVEKLEQCWDDSILISKICVVNCLGGAELSEPGQTFEDINVTPLQNTMNAVERVFLKYDVPIDGVSCSTITAEYIAETCPYANSREIADQWFVALHWLNSAIVLRPGIILSDLKRDCKAYSPEQVISMPYYTPILGSGKTILESVSDLDLVHAVFNTFDGPVKKGIVNAVTRHQYTQLQLFSYFAQIYKRPFRPLHICLDYAAFIGNNFPLDRLACYTAPYLQHKEQNGDPTVSPKTFEGMLGKDPVSLEDRYPIERKYPEAPSPIARHFGKVIKTVVKKPSLIKPTVTRSATVAADLIQKSSMEFYRKFTTNS